MYHDIRIYKMLYLELKNMCRKAWSEKFNYLGMDKTEMNEGI